MKRTALRLAFACALSLALLPPSVAQDTIKDWPTRTVRIYIPLGAGGGGDIFARLLAEELQKKFGQSFIVENRPGGGLNIGARACAEAASDGYTICVMSSEPVVFNQFLFKNCRSTRRKTSSRSPICSLTRWRSLRTPNSTSRPSRR